MNPPPFSIEALPRLDRGELAHCDFSFDVTAVALPPFAGDDIGGVMPISPYRKDYGGDHDLAPDTGDLLLVARAGSGHAGGAVLGYLLASRDWTGFALIDDVAVDRASRGLGVGRALMDGACRWARTAGLPGLRLETQSTNVPACRFYARHGFRLGGADRLLYAGFPALAHETALFWYLLFDKG